MATFNGLSLGFVFEMSTSPAPTSRQVNAYAGANGLEVLNHGTRGGRTVVAAATVALSAGALAAYEGAFRSLQQSAGAYVLVDTLGTAWSGVILVNFAPEGPVRPLVGGGYARRYTAEFLHIT